MLAKKLINLYPNDKEGQLDKRLASLINKKVCAKVLERVFAAFMKFLG